MTNILKNLNPEHVQIHEYKLYHIIYIVFDWHNIQLYKVQLITRHCISMQCIPGWDMIEA